MKISLICTVLNEGANITEFIESIENQRRVPDEMIVVDGGSTDGTWETLKRLNKRIKFLRIFEKKGNISIGRNAAILKAKWPIIAVTDAGTVYQKNWLKELELGFNGKVSFGIDLPLAENDFEREVGRQLCHGRKQGSSRNMMFLKSIWKEVGGYPEDLDIGEDTIFDERIRRAGYEINEVRSAICYWRMRRTLKALSTQFWRYGFWDGVAFSRYKIQPFKHLVFVIGFAGTMVFSPLYIITWLSRAGRIFLSRRLSYFFGFLYGLVMEDLWRVRE